MSSQPGDSRRRDRRSAQRLAAERAARRRRQMLVIGGVVVVAIIAVVALIFLSGDSASSEPVQIAEAPSPDIPTDGRMMGDPNAPVAVVEWGDYQ